MWLSVAILSVLLMIYVPLVSWAAARIGVKRPGFVRIVFLFGSLLFLQLLHVFFIPQQNLFLLLLIILPASVIATIGLFEFHWQLKITHLLVPVATTCIMLLSATLLVEITNTGNTGDDMATSRPATEAVLNNIALAAEQICLCETDSECIKATSNKFGMITQKFANTKWTAEDIHRLQRYTQRGFDCSYQPGKYDSLLAVVRNIDQDIISHSNAVPHAGRDSQDEAERLRSWQVNKPVDSASIQGEKLLATTDVHSISLGEAIRFIGKSARLQRKNGAVLEGRVIAVQADKVMFEQQKFGGKISLSVSISEIVNLESLF